MAENKKGFVLYADQRSIIDMLSNEKAGELIKHIFSYVNDENPISNDPLVLMAFEPIKLQLKRDLTKWQDTREKRSKAGKISAEKRSQQNQHMLTHVESVQHNSTDSTVIVKDNVNVTVNDKVINNIDSRKTSFATKLNDYLNQYTEQMINDFYSYWSEHGENDKKMRFEKEKSFDLNLRLKNWHKRSFEYNKENKSKGISVDQIQNKPNSTVEDYKNMFL